MKTLSIPVLAWLCILPALARYSGGSGTAADPYQIATAFDLISLGETPDDYDKHFVLTADIDLDPNLPGRKVFDRALIAPDVNPSTLHFEGAVFTGVLDGRGHTIWNLTITGGQYLGLFGWTGPGAAIRRLALEEARVRGTGFYIGSLVGRNDRGSIAASHSSGFVAGDSDVGGLVGCNEYGRILASHSSSSVRGTGWGVGCLVGMNHGSIAMSYGVGSVGGTGSGAGGLAGDNEGSITSSHACGSVYGKYYVGGLAGDNEGRVATSYSSGAAIATHCYVGGLVGEHQGSITMSYSSSLVGGVSDAGGLAGVGAIDSMVSLSFWSIETSGQATSAGGTSISAAGMRTAGTFLDAGWDFADANVDGTEAVWTIAEGSDYPRLAWEYGAFCCDPCDGALDVPQAAVLSWVAGNRVLACDVYFGEEETAVANAAAGSDGVYRGRQPAGITTYDPGALEGGKTYYWRIDAVNQIDPDSPRKGAVWMFATADRIAADIPDELEGGTCDLSTGGSSCLGEERHEEYTTCPCDMRVLVEDGDG